MMTVTDIEHAIESLPAPEVSQLAQWIEDYQLMLSESADVFRMLDGEEGEDEQWSEQHSSAVAMIFLQGRAHA